jgi:hypothetical protein
MPRGKWSLLIASCFSYLAQSTVGSLQQQFQTVQKRKSIKDSASQPCVLSFISFVGDANLPLVKLNVGHARRMCRQCKMERTMNQRIGDLFGRTYSRATLRRERQ